MLGQSYFQLLSPLIFLVFSGGFLLLWRHARDFRSLRWFGISYFVGALAMFGDFLRVAMHPDVASALLSLLYLAATVTFCAAIYIQYRGHAPWKAMIASAAAVFVLFAWLRYGLESTILCAWAINTGVVALYLYSVYDLHSDMVRRIDRALQIVIAVSSVLLLGRTAIVFWYEGATLTESNYTGSLAAVTLQLLIAIAALAVAGVLFAMFGMDIVRRLTETSETDPLTGVLNRRGFEARITSAADDGLAPDAAHAVVMADIDRFKTVNDTYGHEAGDEVIKAFARLLDDTVRECDYVVRWGGEEFLVVIAHAELAVARLFAEAVRAQWESLPHDCLGGKSVTASFGVAGWGKGQDLSGVNRAADAALYWAKSKGRNRVCGHDPEIAEGLSVAAAG